jgi:hypothetical protein
VARSKQTQAALSTEQLKVTMTTIKSLLIASYCLAQYVAVCQSSKFLTHVYTSQDGLPDSYTFDVIEDHRGYIWAGGVNGLSRFDGNSFHKVEMGNEVYTPVVSNINENEDGAIWIYSGSSAYLLKGTRFQPYENGRSFHLTIVSDIQEPGKFEWWALTGKGFQRFDGHSTKKPIPVPGLGTVDCRRAIRTEHGWYYNFYNDILFASREDSVKSIRD